MTRRSTCISIYLVEIHDVWPLHISVCISGERHNPLIMYYDNGECIYTMHNYNAHLPIKLEIVHDVHNIHYMYYCNIVSVHRA